MNNYELILFAVALGMDAFSAAIAISIRKINLEQKIKMIFGVGFLHFILSAAGIVLARLFNYFFSNYYFLETINKLASVIGALSLILLGVIMIAEGFKKNKAEFNSIIEYSLLILLLSISIDALSAGFGLGMLGDNTIINCLVLGIIVSIMVMIAFFLGDKISGLIGDEAIILGGVILVFLALHLIFN